jgi:hypothetical protein
MGTGDCYQYRFCTAAVSSALLELRILLLVDLFITRSQ